MSRYVDMAPASDGELFDMLHGLFGLGDYDEETAWYKHRAREIHKLKAMRKKRQITLGEFAEAARYCYRRRTHITASWQVTEHIAPAKRDKRLRAIPTLDAAIANAVRVERHRNGEDSPWVRRLLGARGPYRQEVLDAWASQ